MRLSVLHNLYFYNNLMKKSRMRWMRTGLMHFTRKMFSVIEREFEISLAFLRIFCYNI